MFKNKPTYLTIFAILSLSMYKFSKSSPSIVKNIELIEKLKKNNIIQSSLVFDVMKSIDRGDFAPVFYAYNDMPQGIGWAATISAPHMHAWALELLKDNLTRAKKSLDVGSGSGYLTLAFAKMMPKDGIAYGIEHIPQLVEASKENIKKNHQIFLDSGKVVMIDGDGRFGLKEYQPFDVIHVGAASEDIPKPLIDQLALGGRMVIPIGRPGYQDYTIVDKDLNGKISMKVELGVTYVPLTSKEKQCPGMF